MLIQEIEKLNHHFYLWACDHITTRQFKARTVAAGLEVDLRQADLDNTLTGYETKNGNTVILEC